PPVPLFPAPVPELPLPPAPLGVSPEESPAWPAAHPCRPAAPMSAQRLAKTRARRPTTGGRTFLRDKERSGISRRTRVSIFMVNVHTGSADSWQCSWTIAGGITRGGLKKSIFIQIAASHPESRRADTSPGLPRG